MGMKHLLILLALALTGTPAFAKTFSNNFIEFQLPEKWDCQLDGTEWVCQSVDEAKKRDAIIVLAAKIKKEGMDELPIYKSHLEKPQEFQTADGNKVISESRYVKELPINGKPWIDSLHLHSEIPDFYTRYLATVEADLGILITFSVRKDKYNDYAPDIEALVQSLRAFRKPGALNDDPNKSLMDANNQAISEALFAEDKNKKKSGVTATSSNEGGELLLLLLLGAGAVGFIIWKKKRNS